MPDLFAGPYVYLEPQLAFVLDAGNGPVGYVIGTSNTPRFVEQYRRNGFRWSPTVTPNPLANPLRRTT